jgi:hypothetical protein
VSGEAALAIDGQAICMLDQDVSISTRSPGFNMPKKSDFDRLLWAVCVGHGYCGSLQDDGYLYVTDSIPERGTVTAEQFVDWLFMADGEQGPHGPRAMLRRESLRSCFIACMGSNVVDAKRLRRSRRC